MGQVNKVVPKMSHNVFYVAKLPVTALYSVEQMRQHYHDGNEQYVAVRASMKEHGMKYPVFCQAIGNAIRVCTGKQRICASIDLGIEYVSVVIDDHDNSFRSTPFYKDAVRIETSEQGQAYFSEAYEFTIGRFVSLVKRVSWERELEQESFKDKESGSASHEDGAVRKRRFWEPKRAPEGQS